MQEFIKRHKAGNRYLEMFSDGDSIEYILVTFMADSVREMVFLADLDDGNRYHEPIEVQDWGKITNEEMIKICGGKKDFDRFQLK